MIPVPPFLCVITDETKCPVSLAEDALRGGASMIQLRHKTASGSKLFFWAVEICKRCKPYNALCIINDRVDIALASGADGVHLGQQDLPAHAARKLLGESQIIGVSVSSSEEALKAVKDGANYIGFGHIYRTISKQKRSAPVGEDALKNVASLISVPLIAIGGITVKNAPTVISLGASGVAVISSVSKAVDPFTATRELVEAVNRKYP
ncbi:MAG: thiamine phosphate synthase [Chlorobiaceae bacterium]